MLKTLSKDIGLLTIALTLALMANFAYSAWAEPTAAPTGGNVNLPINVGPVNQVKDGGLGVDDLAVFDSLGFTFYNTADSNAPASWRVLRNDGTANFAQYWNTQGGLAPVRETVGHAFRQAYNPGVGDYVFQTAPAGARGGAVTWADAMSINGDSSVNIGHLNVGIICDADGNNCSGTSSGAAQAGWFRACPAGWIDTELTDNDPEDGRSLQEDDTQYPTPEQVRLCLRGGGITDAGWHSSCPAGWVDTELGDCDINGGHDLNEDKNCGGRGGVMQTLCLDTADTSAVWHEGYLSCPTGWTDTGLTDGDSGDGHWITEDSNNQGGYPGRLCLVPN